MILLKALVYGFAAVGCVNIIHAVIKVVSLYALRAEHNGEKTQYIIYDKDGTTPLWESKVVDEFSNDEVGEFRTFCDKWSHHPGALARWERK
jgi:hypothetical protein